MFILIAFYIRILVHMTACMRACMRYERAYLHECVYVRTCVCTSAYILNRSSAVMEDRYTKIRFESVWAFVRMCDTVCVRLHAWCMCVIAWCPLIIRIMIYGSQSNRLCSSWRLFQCAKSALHLCVRSSVITLISIYLYRVTCTGWNTLSLIITSILVKQSLCQCGANL